MKIGLTEARIQVNFSISAFQHFVLSSFRLFIPVRQLEPRPLGLGWGFKWAGPPSRPCVSSGPLSTR